MTDPAKIRALAAELRGIIRNPSPATSRLLALADTTTDPGELEDCETLLALTIKHHRTKPTKKGNGG